MRVFGCARKIGSNEKLFLLIVKYALWPYKSISVFILPSNHLRNSQTRKERKRGRKEDSQTQTQTQWQDRAPTPDAVARSRRRVCGAKFSVRIILVLNPKLIDTVVTDLVLVLDPKLVDAADLIILISSHQWSRRLNLVSISSSPFFP